MRRQLDLKRYLIAIHNYLLFFFLNFFVLFFVSFRNCLVTFVVRCNSIGGEVT